MPEVELVSDYDPGEVVSVTAARQAGLSHAARRLHQVILTRFLDTGSAPDQTWLRREADRLGLDPRPACAELAAADLVHLDPSGVVRVAYPFSGVPTGHRVHLADRPAVWAMCAIDALGIPQMAGREGVITATDPHSNEPVRVEVTAGRWRWDPPRTTVLVAQASTADTGDTVAALCACPHVNFVTSPDHARRYLAEHPGLTGRLVAQHVAVQLAGAVFGPLLAADRAGQAHPTPTPHDSHRRR